MSRELPPGWSLATVGDLGAAGEQAVLTGPFGSNLKSSDFARNGIPVLTIGCLTDHGIDLSKAVFLPAAKAKDLERYILREGDMLFSRMASVGRAGYVTPQLEGALFNYHIMRLRIAASVCRPRFLIAYVRGSYRVPQYLDEVNHGATRPGINTKQLVEMPVCLPGVAEQDRILGKVDALFAHSKKAKASLDRIPALLEKLKKSILAAAFRGDLTKDWREAHPDVEPADKLLERTPTPPRPSRYGSRATRIERGSFGVSVGDPSPKLPSPDGWKWVPLVDVARLESGHTPSRKHPEYWNGEIPWVSIPDGRDHHGGVIYETRSRITQAGLDNSASRLLPEGTVFLCRTAASIGYTFVLGAPMATSQDFVAWVCTEALDPHFLMLLLLAEKDSLLRFAKGSTHRTIYFPEILSLHICLPPIAEQQEIVRRVERRLAQGSAIAASVAGRERWMKRLDQAILAKAFRGELVPQDPTDEPASVLLERIRAERGAAGPTKKKRGGGAGRGRKRKSPRAEPPPAEPKPPAPAKPSVPPPAQPDLPFDEQFLDLGPREQAQAVATALFGSGPQPKDEAIRLAADGLRGLGLSDHKRLRTGGKLHTALEKALTNGVRYGLLDRPVRGEVRAIKPDAKSWTEADWALVAAAVTPTGDLDAWVREAATWAAEHCGLEFSRLRTGGHIDRGLRKAADRI